MKGKTAGLHGVRWPEPRYTAKDMREAYLMGWEHRREGKDWIEAWDFSIRTWPDKAEK